MIKLFKIHQVYAAPNHMVEWGADIIHLSVWGAIYMWVTGGAWCGPTCRSDMSVKKRVNGR
jgi:hypothetical protein